MPRLENDWKELLAEEFGKEYYLDLRKTLMAEYRSHVVYPPADDVLNAIRLTAYGDVKAVILGQDPYHGPGQAHGLSFSVKAGIAKPPSLVNIFKELHSDLGILPPKSGDLTPWAKEGVLLLNSALTVRAGQAGSHANLGWHIFTDSIIEILDKREAPVIFLLWGRWAHGKQSKITNPRHVVLKAAHPSPLSAHNGFFGCGHFSKVNEILAGWGEKPINWGNL